jgi:hypothetical protein
MIDHVEQMGASLGKLRLVIIGGSSAPPATIRWFRDRGVHVNHLWGMTEMSPVGTVGAPPANWDEMSEDEQVAYMARPGRSMFGVELRIVDDEGRVLTRDGKSAGKLQTRGAAVVKRYFKQEKDCVDAEQWFDTGDMATIHADGTIQITDRAKDVIKSGGEWISSIEIENAAVGCDGVAEAAAIGIPHPKWDERPLLVVATAGSVSTGIVDPLTALAEICREEAVWLHVDGAYGGLAAAVPGGPQDLQALRLADSVAVDPHKWLYAPLEAGCILVRDPQALRNAFSYHPPYYHFGEEAVNFFDYGPQNSRGFRALKVWLALRQVGREGYQRMIADDIALSERLFAAAAAHPELEACTQALSIATFRYVPPDLRGKAGEPAAEAYLNTLNEALLERIQNSGEAFVSNAVVHRRYLLRACIVNFHTSEADVDSLPDLVARLGRDVDAELRPKAS